MLKAPNYKAATIDVIHLREPTIGWQTFKRCLYVPHTKITKDRLAESKILFLGHHIAIPRPINKMYPGMT